MDKQPPVIGAATPALAGELKKLILDQMTRRLERMFEGADNLLMTMAERARGSQEQRQYFDTKHLVHKHRAAITRMFNNQLDAGFLPGAGKKKKNESADIDFEELRLCKTRSIEESIAVNNIAIKAANQNDEPLWEIGRRVDWLIHEGGASMSPEALTPATLCDAFRVSTQSLNLDFQAELVIYKLFEQLVVPTLREVYAEALKLLDTGGITVAVLKSSGRAGSPPRRQALGGPAPPAPPAPRVPDVAQGSELPSSGQHFGAAPQPGGAQFSGAAQQAGGAPLPGGAQLPGGAPLPGSRPAGASTSMPALDPRTLDAFRLAQGQPGATGVSYGDAELAAELTQVASGQSVTGWGTPQARANVQAADLVGKMFNGILEDPSVPQTLKPQLDELRFEVIKNALADRSFFANSQHPIRRLINELAIMAAGARTTGPDSMGQLGELVAMIRSQFQVAARSVKAASAAAVPLAEADAERFLDDQLVQGKARRQALIDKARKVVTEEVRLRLLGRHIPDQARPLFASGLTPLLGLRLLRHGVDSDAWREGIALLEKLVDALDPALDAAPDAGAREQLCAQIERDLLGAGMLAPRTAELLVGLRQGFEAAEQARRAPPAPPPPSAGTTAEIETQTEGSPAPEPPTALLLQLLVPGEWFKVHDAERQQKRWLKVVAPHLDDLRPEYHGCVEFAEFSGKNPLLVKVEDLLDHIAAGLTEPFDQSPDVKAALADLIAQQQTYRGAAPDLEA